MNVVPSLDLVICTYNNAKLLDRALAALAAQEVELPVKWRVLVVNNNCTDDTAAVVKHHQQAALIPGLQMVSESQQGLNFARICGVQNTTGDWIAFVDDDCLLKPNWVEQAARFAAAHPECGAFGGKVILDWETPPPAFVLQFGYSLAEQNHGAEAKQVGCLVGAGMVIRRSAILEIGWLNQQFMADRIGKKLVSGGDVELALRLGANYPLWYTPDCQLLHTIPPQRTSTRYLAKINYGLGTSQILGDSMLWLGTDWAWIVRSIRDTIRPSVSVATNALKALVRRRSPSAVVITGSFVLGRWAGIWRLLRMNVQQRQALLGCAAPLSEAKIAPVAVWKVLHLDLSQPVSALNRSPDCAALFVVFWWQGIPLGDRVILAAQLPMSAIELTNLALQTVTPTIGSYLLESGFKAALPVVSPNPARDRPPALRDLLALQQPLAQLQDRFATKPVHSVSIVVCTRDRPEQLAHCLRSLQALSQPPHEIIIVDNAPTSEATRHLVESIVGIRYVREPRPGLSVARNTGIRHSSGDLIAFTDDDALVHPDWVSNLQRAFQLDHVMAMTGLVLPVKLETEAQLTFQQGQGGTSWPYRPLLFDTQFFSEMQPRGVPVWKIGAGANMAFRREIFDRIGRFDERLGAGASGCSEDSEFWYRVLAEGWLCRYEPAAVVFHYHRDDMASLKQQMYQYMRGHVVALLIQYSRYHHWGNLRRLFLILPKYYANLLLRGAFNGFQQRYATVPAEIAGCLAGIQFYLENR